MKRRYRRAKYRDVNGFKPSQHVPFKHGEAAWKRHRRRLEFNLALIDIVEKWCQENKVEFNISKNGHHWHFTYKKKVRADWWPSSAKLVINQEWENGYHVYDWEQTREILKEEIDHLIKAQNDLIAQIEQKFTARTKIVYEMFKKIVQKTKENKNEQV